MADSNTTEIFLAARRYELPLPAAVVAAEALEVAARALREKVNAETAPDLAGVTVKTLAAVHAAAVLWENRDARLRAADAIVTQAAAGLDNAMFTTSQELVAPLGALFDGFGRDFVKALADLGGNVDVNLAAIDPIRAEAYARLREAVSHLDYLLSIRGAYAPRGNRAVTVSDTFEQVSRGLVINDSRKMHRFPLTGRDIPFWAEAVKRGYRIKWQSRAEQETNSREALTPDTAYTATASA